MHGGTACLPCSRATRSASTATARRPCLRRRCRACSTCATRSPRASPTGCWSVDGRGLLKAATNGAHVGEREAACAAGHYAAVPRAPGRRRRLWAHCAPRAARAGPADHPLRALWCAGSTTKKPSPCVALKRALRPVVLLNRGHAGTRLGRPGPWSVRTNTCRLRLSGGSSPHADTVWGA